MTTENRESRRKSCDERWEEQGIYKTCVNINCWLLVYTLEGSREDVKNTFNTRIRQSRNDREIELVVDNYHFIDVNARVGGALENDINI